MFKVKNSSLETVTYEPEMKQIADHIQSLWEIKRGVPRAHARYITPDINDPVEVAYTTFLWGYMGTDDNERQKLVQIIVDDMNTRAALEHCNPDTHYFVERRGPEIKAEKLRTGEWRTTGSMRGCFAPKKYYDQDWDWAENANPQGTAA